MSRRIYDRQPNESWDQFIVRKMGEERNGDVYPVREDVPAELWGKPIVKKEDAVNDYIKSWDMSYAQGNVIKYVTRYNLKHKDKNLQRQDLEKAEWYLKDLIQELKN